jgi:ATP-dependent Clp protease ATP-binding subunit ClpB
MESERPKILIVDVDDAMLIKMEKSLEDEGFATTTTWQLDSALNMLRSDDSYLLVLGDHPPEINAERVLQYLRGSGIGCACIVTEPMKVHFKRRLFRPLGASVVCKWEETAMLDEIKQRIWSSAKVSEKETLDPTLRSGAMEDFEATLQSRVVGQEDAVKAVVEMFQMFSAGLNPPNRPVGNLLFLGPTGSGKTHLVEVVADALFGSPFAFIKVDCAEFQHSHEIAKLIGSPPGYLGHRETHPALSQEALDRWQTEQMKLSLVLFDEVEKASDALWQLLLGILDKATLTLGDNSRVDFSNCLIFMTSNLGAAEMTELVQGGMGFRQAAGAPPENLDGKITRVAEEAARRKFSPEFMNRIDKVIVFKTLHPDHLERVLDLELALVQKRIMQAAGENQFVFRCTPAVRELLLKEGTDSRFGARHLKRAIERNIVFPLANLVATGQVTKGDQVHIDANPDGTLDFSKAKRSAAGASSTPQIGRKP